ncbi:MAG: DUF5372 family protein [Desulfobacterales bacterium]|nr:DUF5372 family protein [Desulfobacterales bacterium]MDX2480474.1 DUF5372 family protein [Desulfuromusa sp.]
MFKLKTRFKVIHPFHPLSGKFFVTIDYHSSWKRRRLSFVDEQGAIQSIPLEWTDAEGVDPFVALSCGRSFFRVTELLRLVELVADLSEPNLPEDLSKV